MSAVDDRFDAAPAVDLEQTRLNKALHGLPHRAVEDTKDLGELAFGKMRVFRQTETLHDLRGKRA